MKKCPYLVEESNLYMCRAKQDIADQNSKDDIKYFFTCECQYEYGYSKKLKIDYKICSTWCSTKKRILDNIEKL